MVGNYYETLVSHWENREKPMENDVKNQEGLWVCGRCKTPRQKFLKNKYSHEKVTIWENCQCREEAFLAFERKREVEKEEKLRIWRKEEERKGIEKLKSVSLMGGKLEKARFEFAEITSENERNIRLCKNYVNKFEKMEEKSQGFLFWGDVGTGKSFAAGCIANELLDRGVSVLVTSLVKLVEEMSAFDKNGHSEDVARLMRQLSQVKLLVLDELGAERYTPWTVEKIFQIIDARYNADLPVIITTNLTLTELMEEKNLEKKRIYSRILEKNLPLCWHGESWRNKQARNRFDEMLQILEEV